MKIRKNACRAYRISYCDLPKGHEGEHYNSFDEISWLNAKPSKKKKVISK